MLLHDFAARAEECLRLAELTRSPHDRDLFAEMACAWLGKFQPAPDSHPRRLH